MISRAILINKYFKNMLQIKDIKKNFGQKQAVDGINLHVERGEIFSIIGPNGSGKTTLVKMIAGLLKPNSGSILVDGLDVTGVPEKTKLLVGYIPDEPAAWSHMTGEEFLHFIGVLYGISEVERLQRIPELLNVFDLENIASEYFESYSRGSKQKFSILAALLHNPKLLVIDEPIVGLDPISAQIAKKLFVNFAKEGNAVLMVTHTLSVAEEISSRVGFLENGKIKDSGKIAELKSRIGLPADSTLEALYNKLI
jgi:ABC-2 type transport system ATP-binding protein